ncbi:MAG: ferrous iron transport protein A [Chloroflexi bacterium]|nr:ferrous iron transport protein A [Chloroflexota bacterium]
MKNVREPAAAFPLTCAARGETVVLTDIYAGDTLRQRLMALGLNVGMHVRVVQGALTGPVILAVRNDARLAIGQGMAQKIMVKPVEGEA